VIPFSPRPEAELRARFPLALAEVSDRDVALLEPSADPESTPANVFDFAGGLRLIVSRDRAGGMDRVLVRARAVEDGWLRTQLGSRMLLPVALERKALAAYRAISGDDEPLVQIGGYDPRAFAMIWRRQVGKVAAHA
jgi:hypothetical protein